MNPVRHAFPKRFIDFAAVLTHSTYGVPGIVLLNRNGYEKLAASMPLILNTMPVESLNMLSSKRYSD